MCRLARGGNSSDGFVIAAAAPASGRPRLPAVSYIYMRTKSLDLPFMFRLSSEDVIPAWDSEKNPRRNISAPSRV